MKRSILALAFMMATSAPVAAEGDPITEDMKPVMAAARIFASENHLTGDIAVADADEAHIGNNVEINHAPGEKCTFTARRRDEPIAVSISFDRLSSEYQVSVTDSGFYRVHIPGRKGAQCEYEGRTKKCSSSIDSAMMEDELRLMLRALKYIFSNVCQPVELPF